MIAEGYESYRLSDMARGALDSARIKHVLDNIHGPDNQETPYAEHMLKPPFESMRNTDVLVREMWEGLAGSPLYSAFSEDDRLGAMRYVNRVVQTDKPAEWTVQEDMTPQGRLFPVTAVKRRIDAQRSDLGLLTGYGAIDMFRFGFGGMSYDDYASYGFDSLLSFAQFLGACSTDRLNGTHGPRGDAGYTKRLSDSVGRLVVVNADFNGDLYIAASEHYPKGAQDMLGRPQQFAPNRVKEVHLQAYHSTEPELMTTLMAWANKIGLSEDEQRRYFTDAVLQAMGITDEVERFSAQHFETRFDSHSTFGIEIILDHNDEAPPVAANPDKNYVIIGRSRLPQADADICSFLCPDGSLMMRRGLGLGLPEEPGEEDIVFATDEIPLLARALVEQTKKGLGRTSFVTMAGMIAFRFSPDFRAYVRSEEFYRRDDQLNQHLNEFYSAQ